MMNDHPDQQNTIKDDGSTGNSTTTDNDHTDKDNSIGSENTSCHYDLQFDSSSDSDDDEKRNILEEKKKGFIKNEQEEFEKARSWIHLTEPDMDLATPLELDSLEIVLVPTQIHQHFEEKGTYNRIMIQTETTMQILKDEYQITCVIEGNQSSAMMAAKELKKHIQQLENRTKKNTLVNNNVNINATNHNNHTNTNKKTKKNSSPVIDTYSSKVVKEMPVVFPAPNTQQKKKSKDKVHVFVDYSNIFIPIQPLRLNVTKLVEIVENNRTAVSRNVVGSKPPDNVALWSLWKSLRYNVVLGQRLEGKEIFVDEALHSMMIRCIYDFRESQNNVLVLLSGDGNDHVKSTATFPVMCEFALNSGWKVEVWSWKKSLNSQYSKLRASYPNKFSICYLDDHKEALTKEAPRIQMPPLSINQFQLPFQNQNQHQLPFQNQIQYQSPFQNQIQHQLPFQNQNQHQLPIRNQTQFQSQIQKQNQGQSPNSKQKHSPKKKSHKPNSAFPKVQNAYVPPPSFPKFKPYTLVLSPCLHNCTITEQNHSTVAICPYCDQPVESTTIQKE
eukprot:TRINITY_DN585_c0_g1_i2.p1 TRINITY_DN585_c0_g1~~TRINITY_DN585_c0_g1_i2.p1  ORF type:complete len:557 (+),score=118.64 TRINITY_DN585_c0_g1_i2:254-1924(+)